MIESGSRRDTQTQGTPPAGPSNLAPAGTTGSPSTIAAGLTSIKVGAAALFSALSPQSLATSIKRLFDRLITTPVTVQFTPRFKESLVEKLNERPAAADVTPMDVKNKQSGTLVRVYVSTTFLVDYNRAKYSVEGGGKVPGTGPAPEGATDQQIKERLDSALEFLFSHVDHDVLLLERLLGTIQQYTPRNVSGLQMDGEPLKLNNESVFPFEDSNNSSTEYIIGKLSNGIVPVMLERKCAITNLSYLDKNEAPKECVDSSIATQMKLEVSSKSIQLLNLHQAHILKTV